jgi:hypothetical protein
MPSSLIILPFGHNNGGLKDGQGRFEPPRCHKRGDGKDLSPDAGLTLLNVPSLQVLLQPNLPPLVNLLRWHLVVFDIVRSISILGLLPIVPAVRLPFDAISWSAKLCVKVFCHCSTRASYPSYSHRLPLQHRHIPVRCI